MSGGSAIGRVPAELSPVAGFPLDTLAPMPSSLGYAILALVSAKPQSGYDLARQMKPPLGYFWQAKHGQIYPELARLEAAGLLEFEEFDAKVRPPRKVYTATPAGRSALSAWVAEQPQERPSNDELVIKIYAIKRMPGSAASTLLKSQIDKHQSRLAALEQRAAAIESRGMSVVESPRFGDYAAVRRAIGMERDYISWCRWLLREVVPKSSSRAAIRPSPGRARRSRTAESR